MVVGVGMAWEELRRRAESRRRRRKEVFEVMVEAGGCGNGVMVDERCDKENVGVGWTCLCNKLCICKLSKKVAEMAHAADTSNASCWKNCWSPRITQSKYRTHKPLLGPPFSNFYAQSKLSSQLVLQIHFDKTVFHPPSVQTLALPSKPALKTL